MGNLPFVRPIILTLFFTTILLNGCKRDDVIHVKAGVMSEYSNWNQVDYSDFIYHQFKYNLAYLEPETIVPESMKETFLPAFYSLSNELKGRKFADVVDLMVQRKHISRNLGNVLSESQLLLEEPLLNSQQPDFAKITNDLTNKISEITKSTNLTTAEKKMAIAHTSIMKGVSMYFNDISPIRYEFSQGSESLEFRDGCRDGHSWIGCMIEFTGTFALTGAIITHGEGPLVQVPAAIIGGLIGALVGLFECPCDLDCFAVVGLSLKFSDCNPTAEYTVWGFGRDDESLSVVNFGGSPASLLIPVIDGMRSATFTVTQDNPDVPVRTTITSNCSDGQTNVSQEEFIRNLFVLARSVQGVSLAGPDQIAPGFTYTYYGFGLLNNPNYTTRWFVNGGTIINSSNGEATVQWSSNLQNAWIQMEVTNNCSGGQTQVFTLQITGDGPIP